MANWDICDDRRSTCSSLSDPSLMLPVAYRFCAVIVGYPSKAIDSMGMIVSSGKCCMKSEFTCCTWVTFLWKVTDPSPVIVTR